MIDLHAHPLPGLDDGPRKIEESVEMCRGAQEDGIRTIVAVAHTLNGLYRNSASRIKKTVEMLNTRLEEEGLGKR